jgi:hypothetical protein
MAPGPATVTLDVWRVPARDAVRAMLASATWSRRAGRDADVGFSRLLGTGDTRFTPAGADLTRWVALTVWSGPERPLHPAWARAAREHWRARLAPLTARGRWGGHAPFGTPGRSAGARWAGEVLSLTRARLRPLAAARFHTAVPPVAAVTRAADGLRAAMGVGEAPVGYQGTLSLWRDAAAVSAYAWRSAEHRAVVDRTPRERWYAEELFARFAVLDRPDSLAAWADRRAVTR